MNQLDHIVIAHPDLDLAIEAFADLTGCRPAYGGPHLTMTDAAFLAFAGRRHCMSKPSG